MDAREAFVALNLIEHVGPVRVRQLLDCFGDAPAVLGASKRQLLQVQGIGEDTADAIAGWEKTIDLGAELKRIEAFGCRAVIQSDEEYPALLRQIYDPPIVLYVKGALSPKDKNAVAMVGSRQTTHYGLESARKLAYQLAYLGVRRCEKIEFREKSQSQVVDLQGSTISLDAVLPIFSHLLTVVSGGARGIDTAAHQGALAAKGRTVVVLGTGINIVFPFPVTRPFPAVKSRNSSRFRLPRPFRHRDALAGSLHSG